MNITVKQILNDRVRAYPAYKDFKWHSYSHYKARFYMYVSVPLIYLFLKAKVRPNAITVLYILLGIFASICLCLNSRAFIYCGLIILFLRPILDWCDGSVAGYMNMRSFKGHCLDVYGAYSGWIALWTGIGIYAYHKTGYNFLIYTFPLVPLMFALDIKSFTRNIIFDTDGMFAGASSTGAETKSQNEAGNEDGLKPAYNVQNNVKNFIGRVMNSIALIFFDHRARTVDAICLLIFIELNSKLSIMWIYYLAFIAFHLLYFLINFAYFLKGGFLNKELNKIRNV